MGSFSILTNIAGLNAQNQLNNNNVNLTTTLQRLSSGKRINSGADDPAGLEIADSLQANVQALDQATQNANDGIGVAQIADGALQEITNVLTRAITLASEASTGTTDSVGRISLDAELAQIQSEIARIATQTNFNGVAIFTTAGINNALSVFVGDTFAASSISVAINTITVSGSTVTNIGGQNLAGLSLVTQAGAASALTNIKLALAEVAFDRGAVGAGINRLQAAVSVMQTQSQNSQAAESTIRDANMAQEISNLTKYQILAQSGIAALAQANASSQNILSLFKNI